MDNTRCTEDSIPRLRPGIKTGSLVDRYNSKRKQWPSLENKCQGNIVHLQNQVCSNVDFNTLCNFKNNCGSAEANRVNFTSSDSHSNNYYHELFTSGFDLGNVTPNKYKTAQAHTTGHKSCRDRMKARAETRRDILINESSDEDYSSINSLCDLRLMSHKHSIIMDAANSKKSRAARTERYYRRLSREDSFRENDNFRAKNESQNKLHDTGIYAWKRQMHSFAFPNTNHIKECCSNLSFDQNHSFIDNPIYRSIRTDPPTSYKKHSTMEKNNDNLHVHQRESNGGPAYAINMNYNRFRRSDPGNDTILAYKKERSSHVPDPAKDTKLKANDYQASVQIAQLRKPSVNPTRHVKRSYSFQNEIPKKYDAANNVSLTMRRMPLTDEVREGSNNLKNECKWIDLVSSKPNFSAGHTESDFKQRTTYVPKKRNDLAGRDTNSTKASDFGYNSNASNKSLTAKDDTTTIKKRSSKNLEKELSELEKLYNSLRLSDDNLLERAEERCIEEFSQKGQSQTLSNNDKYLSESSSSECISEDGISEEKYIQQSTEAAHVINDDMAYRKMQSNKMPALSETQNSLSQISYLLASSALILDNKTEYPDFIDKVTKEEPNITKDDMVYRNLHYTNNVLKVVEPQPPFGIPLRPATPSTNSNYLCSTPVALKSPPLTYVPQSEPNLITDDLAFRNLRKDAPKSPPSVIDNPNEVNIFLFKNDLDKSLSDDKFCKKKKKAVRSLSANLYGLIKDVHNLELNVK